MKTLILLLMLVGAFIITSCSKDDEDEMKTTTNNITSTIEDSLLEANWHITYYWDTDKEETYHFTGYTFVFNDNNTLTATKTTQVSGTWSVINDDNQDKLLLDFGSVQPFEELNDDWHIKEWSDTKIQLEDVSGGNGGTDYLTFEKL